MHATKKLEHDQLLKTTLKHIPFTTTYRTILTMIDMVVFNRIITNHSLIRNHVYKCTEDDKIRILTALLAHIEQRKYDRRSLLDKRKKSLPIAIYEIENMISRYFGRGGCVHCFIEEIPTSCTCGNIERLREKYPLAFI
jgi:hypothetical protein